MSSPPPITPPPVAALSPELRAPLEASIHHYARRIEQSPGVPGCDGLTPSGVLRQTSRLIRKVCQPGWQRKG